MKKIIKHKSIFLFALIVILITTTIVLFNSLYIPNTFNFSAEITILLLWFIFFMTFSLSYGIFGMISSLNVSLFFTIILVLWKFLEVDFSWSVFSALILSIVISINNCLFLLEKTRINLQKKWNLKKSFEIAKRNTFIINADKNILIFFIASLIFLINKNEISTIGAILAISSTLSFIITSLINPHLIKLFLLLPYKKNSKIIFGLSDKFKWNNNVNFVNKTRNIKYIFWAIISVGIFLAFIFSLIDEFGNINLFQSKVIENINKDIVIDGILTIFAALGVIFLYILIRYKWSFMIALIATISQDIILLISLFIITRLTINLLFVASILSLIVYSISFSINSFSDLRAKSEIHIGEINKNFFYEIINDIFKKSIVRIILTLYFMLFSMIFIWGIGIQDMYTIGSLFGFLIVVISSKTIFPIIWIKMELFRLKNIKKRFDNNFWKTKGLEEQIIDGINNYNP